MVWLCSRCHKTNYDQVEYCHQCHLHWSKAAPWKQRPSRSKSRKDKTKEKAEKAKAKASAAKASSISQEDDKEDLNLIADHMPWVASTPQGRLAKIADRKEVEADLPPNPELPSPPTYSTHKAGLTDSEDRVLNGLRELKDAGEELTEKQISKLDSLEAKKKQAGQAKELGHGHINRLDKAKGRVSTLAKKIAKLDQEWHQFVGGVTEKIQTHSRLYLTCRQELVANYQQRMIELQQIREETHQASSSLLGKTEEVTVIPNAPQIGDQMAQLFTNMEEATRTANVNQIVVSDDDMEAELVPEPLKEDGKQPARKPQFQGAKSPNRVAQCHLKPKDK